MLSRNHFGTTSAARLVAVTEIWRDVLREDGPLEVDVNFFDAGGDSLALLRMQAMLNARFDIDLCGTDLFEHTTIQTLAALIGTLTG